jgi:hypothetical protein
MMGTGIANTREGFYQLVKKARNRLAPEGCSTTEFWYRGHDRGIYTLTPSLFRYEKPIEKELELFDLCATHAGKIAKHGPNSWARVAWMQHYGIPTRLLDWTAELNHALFFAVNFLTGKTHDRKPHDGWPCIYILNPARLNQKHDNPEIRGVPRVPEDTFPDFEHFFSRDASNPLKYPLAVAPVNFALEVNDRLQAQRGRFTVHGLESDALEYLAPDCVFRISLTEKLCKKFRDDPVGLGCDALKLFPDFEGIAQFVASKAHLKLVQFEKSIGRRIEYRLRERAQHDLHALIHREEKEKPYCKGVTFCNLDDAAYLKRDAEASRIVNWLGEDAPYLFITGEAGVGKTNFIVHSLWRNKAFEMRPSIFFSLKMYGTAAGRTFRGGGAGKLARHLYDIMFNHDPTEQERHEARKMISEGRVVLALDGLDELARVRSAETVEEVVRDLDGLIGGSPKARVIITCRRRILDHLQKSGALGRTKHRRVVRLRPFPAMTIRDALRRQFGKLPDPLVEMARVPLFYDMIRRAPDRWQKLCKVAASRTKLEEEWFKIILQKNRYRPNILRRLGTIAGKMLHDRSDLISAKSVDKKLQRLLRRLSHYPFALFVEESKNTYSFSHQSLREFVLAWCVTQEIKNHSFVLLKSSSSFDYEGHEYYDRVRHLLSIQGDVIRHLRKLLTVSELSETERNHVIRNVFEMLGQLTPADDSLAKRVAVAALPYLKPSRTEKGYVTYKTRYNIVRCLERIHWSAPRPYIDHIIDFGYWTDPHYEAPPGEELMGAYAIRGFHRPRQEATPIPPILYKRATTPAVVRSVEAKVANCLITVIEGLLKEREKNEDGGFLGINCTLALIRWLSEKPNLAKIEAFLQDPETNWQMKQNLFYALFARYGKRMPDRFRGLFRDVGKLRGSAEAKAAFKRLAS